MLTTFSEVEFLKTIEVQEKKKKVVVLCSRPLQNVKLGIFTSCNDGEKNTKKRDARAKSLFC